MTEVKRNSQSLGVITLVLAILAFVFAIIPCVGLVAIVPGIIAITLPLVELLKAKQEDSPRGLLISGLIIAVVAVMISFSQILIVGKIADAPFNEDLQEFFQDIEDEIRKGIDGSFSIHADDNENTIDITVNSTEIKSNNNELKILEDLETGVPDTTK